MELLFSGRKRLAEDFEERGNGVLGKDMVDEGRVRSR